MTHSQYVTLVKTVYKPLYRGVFSMMYTCGLRISEAVAVRTSDINGEAMTVRVIGKGNKERLVPVPPELLDDLRLLWKGHRCRQWLFPNRAHTGAVSAQEIAALFRKLRGELGWSKALTPHSLRHGFASRLFEQELPAETIAILMGHENVKTTKRYLHLTEAIREQVKNATANHYVSLFD